MDKFFGILKNFNYRWRYKLIWCFPIFFVLVLADWITKSVAVSKWKQGFDGDIIPGFLHFNFLVNFGSAYGANANRLALTVTLATLVTIFIMGAMVFVKDRLWTHSINIFLAGAFGNLIARSWAPEYNGRRGGVVDFVSFNPNLFPSWVPNSFYLYSFNIADMLVNIAVVLLVICTIVLIVKETKIHFMKKNQEIHDYYDEILLHKETLDQKLIVDIKKQPLKIQYFLYSEWRLNSSLNMLLFKIYCCEIKSKFNNLSENKKQRITKKTRNLNLKIDKLKIKLELNSNRIESMKK